MKAEVVNYLFATVFTSNYSSHTAQVTEGKAGTRKKDNHCPP